MRYFRTQHTTSGYLDATTRDITEFVDGIARDNLVFLDDIYRHLASRIATLQYMYLETPEPITATDMLTSSIFTDRHVYFKNHADHHYLAIPECYDRSNTVVQSLYDNADSLSQQIAQVDAMLENMQALVTNNNMSSSIYDEITVYDTCDQFSLLQTGSLFHDVHAGCIVLPVTNTKRLAYTIQDIAVNQEKGVLTRPSFGDDSYTWLPTGYMTNTTVGVTPVFENEGDASTAMLSDGDPLTMVYRERLSRYPMNPFTMDITITCDAQAVDALRLVCANIGSDAKTDDISYAVSVRDCSIRDAGSNIFSSYAAQAIDNRIAINGKSIGTSVTDIVNVAGDMYPGAVLYLGAKNATAIKLKIVNTRSSLVTFKEKVITDSSGQILHTFNYPETLFLNGYVGDGVHATPSEWYDAEDKMKMQELLSSAVTTTDQDRIIYRNAIGIRELELLKCTYATSGEILSSNINSTGKPLASCELYVNHVLPDGCGIEYYLSTDRDQWHQVMPKNLSYTDTDILRVVFDDRLPIIARDLRLIQTVTTLYLKVIMRGTSMTTPVLKAYAVRLKHL